MGLPEEVTAWQRDLRGHGVCFRSRQEAPVAAGESAGVGEGESVVGGTGVRSSESGFVLRRKPVKGLKRGETSSDSCGNGSTLA